MRTVRPAHLLVAATLAAAASTAAAALTVESSRLDLGQVMSGEDAVAVFVFHNDGPDPVRILKAKPS